ncbi:hypothetical protein Gbfr_040_002 [Gluconobacter frateurii M-2]|nr:hypothetical protein Gbfr_040_002 [Gluconobacter frateurii M-2]
MAIQTYAIYLTAASGDTPVGTVVNRVEWDGSQQLFLSSGQAAIADPDNKYPRGSTYAAGAS